MKKVWEIVKKLAKRYLGGTALLFRLGVTDYHRYCYPDNAKKSRNRYLPGVFHTVNPVAMEHYKIYAENSREYTVIDSDLVSKIQGGWDGYDDEENLNYCLVPETETTE